MICPKSAAFVLMTAGVVCFMGVATYRHNKVTMLEFDAAQKICTESKGKSAQIDGQNACLHPDPARPGEGRYRIFNDPALTK
ncbi:MAG: hypothetical protein WCD70_03190 [Alphaproteobacteria bacterium]